MNLLMRLCGASWENIAHSTVCSWAIYLNDVQEFIVLGRIFEVLEANTARRLVIGYQQGFGKTLEDLIFEFSRQRSNGVANKRRALSAILNEFLDASMGTVDLAQKLWPKSLVDMNRTGGGGLGSSDCLLECTRSENRYARWTGYGFEWRHIGDTAGTVACKDARGFEVMLVIPGLISLLLRQHHQLLLFGKTTEGLLELCKSKGSDALAAATRDASALQIPSDAGIHRVLRQSGTSSLLASSNKLVQVVLRVWMRT